MEWTDDAIVLSARPFGDTAALVVMLTREHGRHAGVLHGGQSSRYRGVLEPGAQVTARWRARTADQLGTWTVEPVRSPTGLYLDDPLRLAAIVAATALMDAMLAEREAHPGLYDATLALFAALDLDIWPAVYVRWEVGLLEEVGFGLDLTQCASTGQPVGNANDQLAYVSPRTGRAVSASAGEPYRDKLLPLPGFLVGLGFQGGGEEDVAAGLRLTGYFLERHVFAQRHAEVPPARQRLVERYLRTNGLPAPGGDGAEPQEA
ncbi:DNA replication and repair protein RecO [Nitrospirillum amazonense]|uniref:DNA repair protein RecO n=1 Tax=Nitrospirillum amazonense TaxID=28077 RepID=A0A560FKG0_9PROT|nr:DNA repair protein RecO [Nitrospirillum amazonense]TWB22095.1 DNA replication and repair protein RecO [Nitrospirillum amazonense]